jgi:hypothetical protein
MTSSKGWFLSPVAKQGSVNPLKNRINGSQKFVPIVKGVSSQPVVDMFEEGTSHGPRSGE